MIDPIQLWKTAGDSGARMLAVLSGLIAFLFGIAFFGASVGFLPFAAMVLASVLVAAAIAFNLWRLFAMRPDGVNAVGAMIVGAVSPILGKIYLDALGVIYVAPPGSGGGLASSVLLAFWPLGVLGVLAGIAAGLATTASVRRRFAHLNVSGVRTD